MPRVACFHATRRVSSCDVWRELMRRVVFFTRRVAFLGSSFSLFRQRLRRLYLPKGKKKAFFFFFPLILRYLCSMKWTEWLLLGVLRGLSRLPLRVLYVLSDCLFPVVFYVVRYRRRLVQRQLADSLPEKTAEERRRI